MFQTKTIGLSLKMCLREMKKTEGTLSLSSTRLHGGGGAAEEDMAEQ